MQGYRPKGNITSESLTPLDCSSSIMSYEETVFKKIVKADDEDSKRLIIDYATKYAERKHITTRVLFLDQDVVEEIVDLGIQEYLRRKQWKY